MGYFICAIPSLAENINVENLDAVRYVVILWPTTALALGLRAVLLSNTYGIRSSCSDSRCGEASVDKKWN